MNSRMISQSPVEFPRSLSIKVREFCPPREFCSFLGGAHDKKMLGAHARASIAITHARVVVFLV